MTWKSRTEVGLITWLPLDSPKARSDGVSVSGLRAAPGLGLSSDSFSSAVVLGPGIGTLPFEARIGAT